MVIVGNNMSKKLQKIFIANLETICFNEEETYEKELETNYT